MADDAQTLELHFIKEEPEEPVHLPHDLVSLVLSKLPLKSLKRFACVCKLWPLLFEDPGFMKILVNNFISNWSYNNQDTSVLLCYNVPGYIQLASESSLFSLSSESIQSMVKLEWPNPLREDDPNFFVMGSASINGILCLYQRRGVVLWNPTTAESKAIPFSLVHDFVPPNQQVYFDLVGFGYDRVRDDYKLIRYACFYPNTFEIPMEGSLLEIYSLRSNSWRTLGSDKSVKPHHIDDVNRLYLDGMCHWLGGFVDDFDNFETFLVSFDLSTEVFYTTSMPSDMPSSDELLERDLLLLNESVAVITNPTHTTDYYISILGQVGAQESWTQLFILKSLPSIGRPVGTGKKGNIFFANDNSELIQFHLGTQMIEEFGVKVFHAWSKIVLYEKSFRQIVEINN